MLNVCQACTCRFAVDLKTCPQCGSASFVHESQLEALAEYQAASNELHYAELELPDPIPAAGSTPPPSSPGSSAAPSEDGAGDREG